MSNISSIARAKSIAKWCKTKLDRSSLEYNSQTFLIDSDSNLWSIRLAWQSQTWRSFVLRCNFNGKLRVLEEHIACMVGYHFRFCHYIPPVWLRAIHVSIPELLNALIKKFWFWFWLSFSLQGVTQAQANWLEWY